MRKVILAVALIGLWEAANAIPTTLGVHNQVSSAAAKPPRKTDYR